MPENQQIRHLLLKNLETLVQKCLCLICKKKIQSPVTTSCGHHFCRACILNIVRSRREAVCPTCKEKVTEKSIVINERTTQLFESLDILLKACNEELKLTVEPAAATPEVKKDQQKTTATPTAQKNTTAPLKLQSKTVPTRKKVLSEEKKKSNIAEVSRLAVKASSEESLPNSSPALPKKQVNPESKVSSWLKNASSDAIPTQDHPLVLNSPTTQSTLISVSQSRGQLLSNKYTNLLTIQESKNKERVVKDPYDFIPSQPDSIIKKPKEKVKNKPIKKAKQQVTLKNGEIAGIEKIPEKQTGSEMLLFQSQSEQYIAAQEEKRLKEIEKPVELLSPEPKVKRQRNLKTKISTEKSCLAEQKIQQNIEEAEKYNLLVEKKIVGAKVNAVKQALAVLPVESRVRNKRRLSADIKSVAASSTPKRVIFNVSSSDSEEVVPKKTDKVESKLNLTSPGFSRLKRMKSDFRSPAKKVVVPLDVSTSSVPQRHLDITEPLDQHSEHTSARIDTSSPQSQKQKPPDSPNSSYSSIGNPDFEKVAALQQIVGQLENELQDNESDTENIQTSKAFNAITIGDTQTSVAFIENSEPNEPMHIIPPDPKPASPVNNSASHSSQRLNSPLKKLSTNQTDTHMSETWEKNQTNDLKPPRKTFSLESNTGDIMTDIPSRESTQQQLISLTSQSKSEQSVVQPNPAVATLHRSLVKFVKQGRLSEGTKSFQVTFLKLGYLAPSNLKKGIKYLSFRCYCKGVAPKAVQPPTVAHHSTEVQTTLSQVCQHSIQVQTSPSLAQLESREVQTSTQASQNNRQHFEAKGVQTSQSLSSSRLQEELRVSQALKCSNESFKSPQVHRVPSPDGTLFDDEMEEEDEVTVIEKTQEDNIKINPRMLARIMLFPELTENTKIMSQQSTGEKEMTQQTQEESMNTFTINSDDILQASISEPIRNSIFDRKVMHNGNSSPLVDHKSSVATTPMSHCESDFNECDEVVMKGKLRKRNRAQVISSDSESEDPNPTPVKRVSRLSIKKKVVIPETPGSSLTTDSDMAPVRAVVMADLAHARAVAALPSEEESSQATINLESQSPLIASSPLNRVPATPESAGRGNTTLRELSPAGNFKEDSSAEEQSSPAVHPQLMTPKSRPVVESSQSRTSTTRGVSDQIPDRKQCEESDSDPDIIIESTPLRKMDLKQLLSSPPTPPKKPRISIVYSQLDLESIKLVDSFLKKFRNEVSHSEGFLPETTHVVMPFEKGGLCSATLKFLLAVACGRWVVNIHWVRDCMETKRLIPEEPYEVLNSLGQEGPKQSRLGTHRLFKDFEFHCSDGEYKFILKENLETVITYAGGKLIELGQLKSPCTRKYRLVLVPTEDVPAALQDCRSAIAMLDWVVESVEQHCLTPILNHLARTIDEQLVLEQGFPSEMLEEEESTLYGSTNGTMTTMTSFVTPS